MRRAQNLGEELEFAEEKMEGLKWVGLMTASQSNTSSHSREVISDPLLSRDENGRQYR